MIASNKCYWNEIKIGRVINTESVDLGVTEIRAFATNFDPQAYHLDRGSAEASIFGGLWPVVGTFVL